MFQLIRTTGQNPDFVHLVKLLDAYLTTVDGDDHAFYDQYNKIDKLQQVVIAYVEGRPVGCGAIKAFAPSIMEVKRMFTLPASRGLGIASKVLTELEAWAAELGAEKCILETGKRQIEAVAFYPRNGYQVTPNFEPYVGVENSVCFEKVIG